MKFMEIDRAGHILHIMDDVCAAIIPPSNRVTFGDSVGKPLQDPVGRRLSAHGEHLLTPLPIDDETFALLSKEGLGRNEGKRKWVWRVDHEIEVLLDLGCDGVHARLKGNPRNIKIKKVEVL